MLESQHGRVLAKGDCQSAVSRVVTLAVARSRGEGQGFPIEPGSCSRDAWFAVHRDATTWEVYSTKAWRSV